MPFVVTLPSIRLRTPASAIHRLVLLGMLSLAGILSSIACSQQAPETSARPAPKASAPTPAPTVVVSGPRWQDLTKQQRLVLQPLATTWDALGGAHKNKWIALASNYSSRTPEDQKKLQSRMAEWAALTPGDRERARLNFAETKKLRPSERAVEWAAYQELSAEERKRLAEKGAGKPAGAAVAVTPVSGDKLTAVPITRRTGQLQESAAIAKPQIDPNTLLPKVALPTPNGPAAVNPDSSSGAASVGSSPAISSDTLSPN